MPTFVDAVEQVRKFLISQQVSQELLWVLREDGTSRSKRRILVKEPVAAENARLVESLYERGCERGLGVPLEAVCLSGWRVCCYIRLPEDESEAEPVRISGLKMSVATDLLHARAVRSNVMWRVHVWLDEQSGWNKAEERLPRKATSNKSLQWSRNEPTS